MTRAWMIAAALAVAGEARGAEPGVTTYKATYRVEYKGKEAGVSDYSIHLDEQTNTLFGVLWRRGDHSMADLPKHPVMQRWWAHMADIMETKPDNEPVAVPLETVFHMK